MPTLGGRSSTQDVKSFIVCCISMYVLYFVESASPKQASRHLHLENHDPNSDSSSPNSERPLPPLPPPPPPKRGQCGRRHAEWSPRWGTVLGCRGEQASDARAPRVHQGAPPRCSCSLHLPSRERELLTRAEACWLDNEY